MKYAFAIIPWLALLPSAWAQGVFTPTISLNGSAVVSYTGPGDIISYNVYYGLRAYSAATLGSKLVNACNSTGGVDVLCADLFSSPTTGDIVPALISGVTCPGNANCTIKTVYDLTGHGIDVTQATVASRPTFLTSAFSGTRTCMTLNGTQNLASSATETLTYPITVTYVAQRTTFASAFSAVFWNYSGAALPNAGFHNTSGNVFGSAGTVMTASATEGNPHSVQTLFSGVSSTSSIMVDGTAHPNLNAGGNALIANSGVVLGGNATTGQRLTGVICEVGMITADATANNATITTNQRTWYGF